MTIVGAIIGSLVCGASGYFAGYMNGASKWFDEIENREATTILNNVTARTTVVALGANMNIFLGCPTDLHHKVGVANATIKTISVSEIQTLV